MAGGAHHRYFDRARTSAGEQSAIYYLDADFAEELAQKLSAAARLIATPEK